MRASSDNNFTVVVSGSVSERRIGAAARECQVVLLPGVAAVAGGRLAVGCGSTVCAA